MTRSWLPRRPDDSRLAEQVEALERQMAEQVDALERQSAEQVEALQRQLVEVQLVAQTAIERTAAADRQVRALRRMMRAGANRLDRVLAASAAEAQQQELARLKAALTFMEHRIEDEAEQARRGIAGLFQQLRSGRSGNDSDRERRSVDTLYHPQA